MPLTHRKAHICSLVTTAHALKRPG